MINWSLMITTLIIFILIIIFGWWIFATKKIRTGKILKLRWKGRILPINSDSKTALIFSVVYIMVILFLLIKIVTITDKLNYLILSCIVLTIPYLISTNKKRKQKEMMFTDIIIYCHNMALLLKQTGNVHISLNKVVDDVNDRLSEDIRIIINSLEASKTETENILMEFSCKYPYTVIKNLNAILIHMHYENDQINEAVLNTFYDDTETLNKDVKENGIKRKSLRLQYILITVGCLLSYWFLLNQLEGVFTSTMMNDSFKIINSIYLFLTLFILFIVDSYFNSNITRE